MREEKKSLVCGSRPALRDCRYVVIVMAAAAAEGRVIGRIRVEKKNGRSEYREKNFVLRSIFFIHARRKQRLTCIYTRS